MRDVSPMQAPSSASWLPAYYSLRAGVSVAWITLAVLVGARNP